MKTIDERAKKYGIESANLLCSDFSEEQRERQAEIYARVYSDIATEEIRKLNEEWEENLAIQRYMLIDKACKWLKKELKKLAMDKIDDNFLDNKFKVVLKSDIPKWLDNFRKTME